MINIEEAKLQCENGCIHAQVCGHKEQWANYCKEHIKLREKSILFDEEPNCRYYIHESRLKEEESISKINKDSLTEKIKRSKEGRNPYKDDYSWLLDEINRKNYEQIVNSHRENKDRLKRMKYNEELTRIVEKILGI